ncbi:plastid-lipid-associated protein 6 [Quercus suber]|uniref:Plastid-lipid-associated protein 6 n=1 Tax=Quercus suber TaxID=58331 RepID=A0AAW0L8H5_QUESU
MASLSLLPTFVSLSPSPSLSPSSSSSSSSVTCLSPSRIHTVTVHSPRWSRSAKRSLVPRSTLDEVSVIDPPPPPPPSEPKSDLIESLKLKLLADAAAKELEDAGGLVDLSSDLDKLQGRWKLIYSSAFSSRTLGGSRPGPPTGRLLPITLGQVFQRIDILSKDFDNIVELELGTPWPLPPVEVTATLAHKFEVIGSAKIKITFEKTTVKTTGNLSQLPPLELPRIPDAFRPQSNRGSGEFQVTYLDTEIRVTRGDRDELRVFVIS